MKNLTNTQANYKPTEETLKTIVGFHIGRGGRYWNSGHKSFIGQDVRIGQYTEDLFIMYENYRDLCNKAEGKDNILDLLQNAHEGDLSAYDRLKNWGLDLGKLVYTDCNGNQVGLTADEEATGIGRIRKDGDYDTTYTCYLEDCSEAEIEVIYNSDNWKTQDIIEYCEWILEIKND